MDKYDLSVHFLGVYAENSHFQYRIASASDLEWCYEVFKAANVKTVAELAGGAWPEAFQRNFYEGAFQECVPNIISIEGQDIGIFAIEEQEEKVKIRHLHIHPDFQGQGIGTSVLKMALNTAHQVEKPLELEVLENNEAALSLYKKFGFYTSGDVMTYEWVREIPMCHKDTDCYRHQLELQNIIGK